MPPLECDAKIPHGFLLFCEDPLTATCSLFKLLVLLLQQARLLRGLNVTFKGLV